MTVRSSVLDLTPRQGCVIEAAAAVHHFRNIWVLLTGGNISRWADILLNEPETPPPYPVLKSPETDFD